MKKLYAISGVSGMTGSELVHQILMKENNADVILGFDNFYASSIDTVSAYLENECFTFFEYDINNKQQMADFGNLIREKKGDFDEIIYINCAAVVHTEHFYNVYETFDTNVIAMNDFLQQAIDVGADIFINCSTSEVYSMESWNTEGGVREDAYLKIAHAEHSQRTSYAVGKLLTEFFVMDAVKHNKILGCSIRFANVYSKNEKYAKHIIPLIINSLIKDGSVTLLENSKKNRRTFLNNFDSCSAVLALIDSREALDGSVYNVATDEEITILDLVKLCGEKLGISNPKVIFEGYRESDPERRVLSTEKIRQGTSWVPKINLSRGLDECIENYSENESII